MTSSYGGTLAFLNSSRIFSASWKTRRKLRPASFFRSSTLHFPVPINSAKSVGYEETSSSPWGTLKNIKLLNDCFPCYIF